MIDHLWYFVSRGEPDGPSGHVAVCPGPVVAVGMDGSDVPGGYENAGHWDVHTRPQRVVRALAAPSGSGEAARASYGSGLELQLLVVGGLARAAPASYPGLVFVCGN